MTNKEQYIVQLELRSRSYKDVLYIVKDIKERSRIQSLIEDFDFFIDNIKRMDDYSFNRLIPYELNKAFNDD
jgi:hypothetical protein